MVIAIQFTVDNQSAALHVKTMLLFGISKKLVPFLMERKTCSNKMTYPGFPLLPTESASLVAQLVKNLPAMQETWVLSLAWEDPLEKKMATHPSILAWRTVRGVAVLDTTEQLSLSPTESSRLKEGKDKMSIGTKPY